jgi:hypothetical protein
MAKNKNHSLFLLFLVPIKTNDRGEEGEASGIKET